MQQEGTADVPDCRTRLGRGGTSASGRRGREVLVLAVQLGQQPLDRGQKEQALKVAAEPRLTPQVEQCLQIQVNQRADCRGGDAIAPKGSSASFSGKAGIPIAANCSARLNDARTLSNPRAPASQAESCPVEAKVASFPRQTAIRHATLEQLVEEVQRLQMSCHRPFLAKQRMVFVLEGGLRVERNGSASHQSVPWWCVFDLRREISVPPLRSRACFLAFALAREELCLCS